MIKSNERPEQNILKIKSNRNIAKDGIYWREEDNWKYTFLKINIVFEIVINDKTNTKSTLTHTRVTRVKRLQIEYHKGSTLLTTFV